MKEDQDGTVREKNCNSVEGSLGADGGPALGCSLHHEREGIPNLFVLGRVNVFVYQEVGYD